MVRPPSDQFVHIRLILGFVVSFSLARLLSGLARFVQHPGRIRVDTVHLLWVFAILVLIVHFWWWEFWLAAVPQWSFALYAFILVFALQLYLLTALLFPDDIAEYAGYGDYFLSRRAWFFGLFASVNLFDVVDTLIKGREHMGRYGWDYWVEAPVYVALSLIAIATRNRTYHIAFAALVLAWEILSTTRALQVLG